MTRAAAASKSASRCASKSRKAAAASDSGAILKRPARSARCFSWASVRSTESRIPHNNHSAVRRLLGRSIHRAGPGVEPRYIAQRPSEYSTVDTTRALRPFPSRRREWVERCEPDWSRLAWVSQGERSASDSGYPAMDNRSRTRNPDRVRPIIHCCDTAHPKHSVPPDARYQPADQTSATERILDRRHHPHALHQLALLGDPLRGVAREDLEDPLVRLPDSVEPTP